MSSVRIENSFIPVDGVGETTERKLWKHGITQWEEFTGDVVGPTRAKRIDEFIGTARERLDRRDAEFFRRRVPDAEHWRLYENLRSETAFLDIETTGLDHYADRVTTVSIQLDGTTRTLVHGSDLDERTLEEALADASLLVTFNGRRFDVPFLETAFDCSIDLPHADLMYMCRSLGYSGGLSAVEAAFDIDRDRPDISGKDAVRLWREYERGSEDALDTLIEYNREDTENMKPLMEQVCDRLHHSVFESVVSE